MIVCLHVCRVFIVMVFQLERNPCLLMELVGMHNFVRLLNIFVTFPAIWDSQEASTGCFVGEIVP